MKPDVGHLPARRASQRILASERERERGSDRSVSVLLPCGQLDIALPREKVASQLHVAVICLSPRGIARDTKRRVTKKEREREIGVTPGTTSSVRAAFRELEIEIKRDDRDRFCISI